MRVVLLARAGDACDRLSSALGELGAELTLADPASADPQALAALQPHAVLVALEPAIEDSLERFDALLSDPQVTVVFDEAELAAQRAGWDAARWTRHLAAKLNRHEDVLPPGSEAEGDLHPSPGPLPSAQDPDELDIASFADEAQELAAEVPGDDSAPDAAWGGSELVDIDALFAATPADADAAADPDAGSVAGADSDGAADASMPAESSLELADADVPFAAAATTAAATPTIDLDALDERVASLSLADADSYGHGPLRGAVLVEGGLGGPDAVRQLLAALPEGFPRPVLVRLHLDGGRYDRLVKQMERAATLPVALAKAGLDADAGTVYFLPPSLAVARERGRLRFVDDEGGAPAVLAALPANDSAILLMSGSDSALVDAVMAQAGEGALVAAQAADSCYDAAAPAALVSRGGAAGTPAELVERLVERWPS